MLINRQDFIDAKQIKQNLLEAKTVIDVGCGLSPIFENQNQLFNGAVYIGVEPFKPYVDVLQEKYPKQTIVNDTWEFLIELRDSSIDIVFASDLIEHLDKNDGERFISEAKRVANKQVLIQSPLGEMPQSYKEDESDFWGFIGNSEGQTHKSAWYKEDFYGWDMWICDGFHTSDSKGKILESPVSAFYALWRK
jgi:ubiquinone/menaquinone biosynthesis C-methylase UbiE